MPLRVVELFAGVGGFRIGLEGAPGSKKNPKYAVVWRNQWEPSTKKQHAAEVYVERWGLEQSEKNPLHYHAEGEVFVNDDIAEVDAKDIPEHDLLVGGFPCQDYSVAKTAKHAAGIEGKKGVLWWEIHRILKEKMPSYAMLENVDRLLKSPTSQRGRDFAVMLASFAELGYIVEWRVINAADYGMPQRRRRVFIMAYAPGTSQYESLKDEAAIKEWMEKDGLFAKAFPINPLNVLFAHPSPIKGPKDSDLADVSDNFNKGANPKAKSPFKKSGIMVGNNYYTYDTVPKYDGPVDKLSDVLLPTSEIPDEYVLDPSSILKHKGWKYLKGAKDEPRKGTGDFVYQYKEGPMIFPDALDKPSRTIITGEGGPTPSRFKHVVKFNPNKKTRMQTNLEVSAISNPYDVVFDVSKVPEECLELRQQMVKHAISLESLDLDLDLNDDEINTQLADNKFKKWSSFGEQIRNLKIHFGKPGKLALDDHKDYDKSVDMRCMVLKEPFVLPPANDIKQLKNSDIAEDLFSILKDKSKSDISDVFRLLSRMRRPLLRFDHVRDGDLVYWHPDKKIVQQIINIDESLLELLMLIEAISINEDAKFLVRKDGSLKETRGRVATIGAIQFALHEILTLPAILETDMWHKITKNAFNGGDPKTINKPELNQRMEQSVDGIEDIRNELGLKKSEWLRRLTPVELERLNMFPDNHTEGPTDGKRAFFMGNALVIGIITRLGYELSR